MIISYHFDHNACYIEFKFNKASYPSLLRVHEMKEALELLFERMESDYRKKNKLYLDGKFTVSAKKGLLKQKAGFRQLNLFEDKGVSEDGETGLLRWQGSEE